VALDRVQPLKIEDTVTGTEVDQFPTALNRNEDFVDCHGMTIQDNSSNDEAVVIARDESGNLTFLDVLNSVKTLSDLVVAMKFAFETLEWYGMDDNGFPLRGSTTPLEAYGNSGAWEITIQLSDGAAIGGGSSEKHCSLRRINIHRIGTSNVDVPMFFELHSAEKSVGVAFTADADTNFCTTVNPHGLEDGDEVCFSNSGGALPADLAYASTYIVANKTSNTFQLKYYPGAAGVVDISDIGTGTHYLHTLTQSLIGEF